MNSPNRFTFCAIAGLVFALSLSISGCQQGGGYSADARDPIGPAPAGIPSPGIGAPGGQSIDTRGTGSVASSEGEATLTGPSSPLGVPGGSH